MLTWHFIWWDLLTWLLTWTLEEPDVRVRGNYTNFINGRNRFEQKNITAVK